ncbi:START domain-containing protein [Chondrinema litorale]|uniref:START domain-containing protein n=1 Tax=Chondrinema litorale TaxID=2994555 RepID=UPI002543B618|nr:START domain-containing protein [Chondrinema litorale]UZR93008.1 START domain-containing protein [Chondrinema litorale]
MKNQILLLLFLASCFVAQAQEDWNLSKEQDGIKVYTRRMEGTGFKEIKAVVEVSASLDACVELFKNADAATSWVDRMEEYRNLEVVNDSLWYTYGELEIPWPFNNKDFVAKNTLYNKLDSGMYEITISSMPEYYPEQDGKKRIKHSEGKWIFKQLPNGNVEASHRIFAEANDFLPPWLVNWVVVGSVYKTFDGFREQLKQLP